MIFQSLEPGDGTRYLVGLERLSEAQTGDTGLGEYLFVFGPARAPLLAWVFRSWDKGGLLTWSYFTEKVRFLDQQHTTLAAFWVCSQMLGRRGEGAPATPAEMGWKDDWPEMLPLRQASGAREEPAGGYVSEWNPPRSGDVVYWKDGGGVHCRRIKQVYGEDREGRILFYAYGNQGMDVGDLIDRRAYYGARCVPCTIPEDAEV